MSLLGDKVFDFPKPSSLIERLLDYGMHSGEGIFLDFFSGSASSSHAVLTKNLKDGGSRTFIAVQLNEDLDKAKVDASIDAKKTIERACKLLDSIDRPHYLTEIGKERIRRVGKQVIGEVDEENKQLRIDAEPKQVPDIGFRVLKLDASCIATAKPGEMLLDRLKPDRSDEDIIFEMMLKWGLDLTYPVEKTEIANYPCYSVAGDALICCMKPGLTVDVIEAIAAREPDRVFMLDSVLDDSLKLNALQIFKRVEERTQRKIDLRTV